MINNNGLIDLTNQIDDLFNKPKLHNKLFNTIKKQIFLDRSFDFTAPVIGESAITASKITARAPDHQAQDQLVKRSAFTAGASFSIGTLITLVAMGAGIMAPPAGILIVLALGASALLITGLSIIAAIAETPKPDFKAEMGECNIDLFENKELFTSE